MSRLASSPAALAVSIALGGLAMSGGCALVYHFDDYTGESSASAGSSGASVGAGGDSSGNGSGSGSGGSGGAGVGSGQGSTGSGSATDPTPVWVQSLGGPGDDYSGHIGVTITPTGQYIFVAGTFDTKITLGPAELQAAQRGVFLARIDASMGNIVWSKLIAESSDDVPAISATPDGGVVIAGSFDVAAYPAGAVETPAGGFDMYVAKLGPNGEYIWGTTIGDAKNQRLRAISTDSDGAVYITGQLGGTFTMGMCTATGQHAGGDGFIAKISGDGICKWVHTWTSPASVKGESGVSVASSLDKVFVGGTITGMTSFDGFPLTGSIDNEAFVATIDPSGDKTLAAVSLSSTQDVSLTLNPLNSNAYFGALATTKGMGDILIGEVGDKIGKTLAYGGQGIDHVRSVASDTLGNFIFTGFTTGALSFGKPAQYHGAKDVFMAIVSPQSMVRSSFQAGDGSSQLGQSVAVDYMGNMYLTGELQGNLNLGGKTLVSSGGYDIFVARYDLLSILK